MVPDPNRASWLTALDDVTGALEALNVALNNEEDFVLLLHQVCVQVTHALPGVDETTVTLLREDGARTAASTSDVVAELDLDQYRIGDGPCLQAARSATLVRVSVADAVTRWPEFACSSRAAGFGSFLTAPLMLDDKQTGAVNCYSAAGHGFAELDEKLLDLYTTAAAATLRSYQRYLRARETAEQLRGALASRAVIDQAKGILMALRQINADEAFTLLAEQSQRENVKVRELAERFVAYATGNTEV